MYVTALHLYLAPGSLKKKLIQCSKLLLFFFPNKQLKHKIMHGKY